MFKAALVGLLVPVSALAATLTADPLFARMVGSWKGEGERVMQASGRHIAVQTLTVSAVQGDKLISHNVITETEDPTKVKTYIRDYWIRPVPSQLGAYDLGVGEQVTSRGNFEGGLFTVEQNFGGEPAYIIRSLTLFDDLGSLYEEGVELGHRPVSQTRIRYRPSGVDSIVWVESRGIDCGARTDRQSNL